MRLLALLSVAASAFAVSALAAPPADQAVKPPSKPVAAPLDLDDPVEPLVPLRPRSEAEADRVRAHSLFSAGRMAEQKQDFAAALRLYQRALRYDSNSVPVLREIVPLAFSQDRAAEAVR